MGAEHLTTDKPPLGAAVKGTVTAAAAAGGLASFLALLLLVRQLLHLVTAGSGVWAATAAALAAGLAMGHLGFRWAATSVERVAAADALRAGAEGLVAAAGVSLTNLFPGGGLVPASGAMAEAAMTLLITYAFAVFVAFAAGVLLLILSISWPIPDAVSRSGVLALKLSAVVLAVVNLLFLFI